MLSFLQRLLGNNNAKEIKKMRAIADHINEIEPNYVKLSDANLVAKTDEFKRRLQKGETLDDILPEAFAVVREASKRVLGMRHFDVQLIGGICLHRGNIAEMRTGEGKTLVATLPVYLNALTGNGVHVVTVNDYLATRDSEQMGRLYNFLGLSTGLIVANLDFNQRKEAYACDITYGTNNEFGFDYLRDNMVSDVSQMVQRPLNYAIVDEVDSILIDEARTPLIISGPGQRSTDNYYKLAKIVPHLVKDEDYTIDEKQKTIAPTDSGIAKVEKMLGVENLYDSENIELNHLLGASLRAYAMMHRDTDYVVKDGEVVIVDEFTGRLMFGRRYSDGLHQAIEAKEGLKVERESQTLASVTFQNYFRMYKKLAGMTGTAKTEEKEFIDIYGLEVLPIPPNKPLARIDLPDQIFKTKAAKYRAVVRNAVERHQTGQPILIGTTSITQSEELSDMLLRSGVPHKVLNAKHHEKEAEIVADAGQMGMVTIATNMAGRGTDITLGEGVPELGGLAILGTERHESRRIDNQLRGRAGRQGDPGSSQFFLSLEDDLMRIFGADNITGIMDKLGMEEDEPIEHSLITKSIERAQKKVEDHNYNIRKYVLEYDDVMNQQREVLYEQRRRILRNESLRDTINEMIDKLVTESVDAYADEKLYPEEWDYEGLYKHLSQYFLTEEIMSSQDMEEYSRQELLERLLEIAHAEYQDRVDMLGDAMFGQLEKAIMLRVVDNKWMEHLDNMDMLREGIGLRAYGQKNPLVEYKFEAFDMFQNMIAAIQDETIMALYKIRAQLIQEIEEPVDHLEGAQPHHEDVLEPQNID
ncbi:MAG: preprotein translocase subunit SecA [Veillonella nakazawae]|uniref:Protein translocase subunit SecA n=4 Tax=Veillonella TaxID=29465 RepID=A0A6N3CDC1_9FIRM|nr:MULTISPECIES: preprotein translocase subunit SecA [unclassified Veillonella]MCQ5320596.1 preprotein translocase subunit SecA [Veillonella parvula]MBS6659182.1 preprotein translocase subunit SecA [Veillonella sp.]MBS7052197.1 preprotein translocase subunit SecA [Veillonella sp.]PQL10965.1 preprotein translocase subunit SecA [Veillonella sp. T11011-6]BBU36028.1 protein translocase subunit SecA [Veillonella sp. S12025-13]